MPLHGSASVAPGGTEIIYTPPTGFTGADSFVYELSAIDGSSFATDSVTVSSGGGGGGGGLGGGGGYSLTAVPDTVTTAINTTVTVPVLSNDTVSSGDTVSVSISAGPTHGTASVAGTSVVYNPSTGYTGTDTYVYTISDPYGNSSSATDTVTVSDLWWNGPTDTWTQSLNTSSSISVSNPGNQSNSTGDTVSVQITGISSDGGSLTYAATGLPSGLSIDPNSGLISGTIDDSAGQSTPYVCTVSATDTSSSASASQSFNWAVGAGAPTVSTTSPGSQTNSVGDSVDLTISASDSGGYALSYTATGLPAGLSINPGSGEITGTISSSAASTTAHSVTVTASDGQSYSSQTFNWTVSAINLTNPSDQTNVDGDAIVLGATVSDSAAGTLSFSASGLPCALAPRPLYCGGRGAYGRHTIDTRCGICRSRQAR